MGQEKHKTFTSFEHATYSILTNLGRFNITTVYYPGYSNKHKYTKSQFLSDFDDFLTSCANQIHLVADDFNIHFEVKNRQETKKLLGYISWKKNGFTQLIKGSTHSAGGTLGLVQLNSIWIKLIFNLNIGKDLLSKVSHHYPVCFNLDVDHISKNQSGKLTIKTRNLGLLDTNMLESLLLNSSLSENFDTLSLHQISVEK